MHDPSILRRRDAILERALVEEYLSEQGHTLDGLAWLDEEERERVMVEAAAYAALRMAEFLYGQ